MNRLILLGASGAHGAMHSWGARAISPTAATRSFVRLNWLAGGRSTSEWRSRRWRKMFESLYWVSLVLQLTARTGRCRTQCRGPAIVLLADGALPAPSYIVTPTCITGRERSLQSPCKILQIDCCTFPQLCSKLHSIWWYEAAPNNRSSLVVLNVIQKSLLWRRSCIK